MRLLLAALLALLLVMPGCKKEEKANGKLQVVTTLFPLYDFAKRIGGDKADVHLLLPPGVEPHSFEPRPEDMVRVNRADLFIYTNKVMEPWADSIVAGLDKGKVVIVEGSKGIKLLPAPEAGDDAHGHRETGADPHVWLDFDNARLIARNILDAFTARDPANSEYYRSNAAALEKDLVALDQRYREVLAAAPKKVLLHGGHYAFGYLA